MNKGRLTKGVLARGSLPRTVGRAEESIALHFTMANLKRMTDPHFFVMVQR
jgi:hypothetical protein